MASFETILVPCLLLASITLDVVTMCARGWILGYHGDVVVLQFSPWTLCRLNCLYCYATKPSFACYALHEWTEQQFDLYRLVVHVHYVTLGLVGLGLLTALFNSAEAFLRQHQLPIRCSGPTLLILTTACVLSVIVVGVVGLKSTQELPESFYASYLSVGSSTSTSSSTSSSSSSRAEDYEIELCLGWAYLARVLSLAVLLIALTSVAYRLFRSAVAEKTAASVGLTGSLDCIVDAAALRELYDDSVDEIDNDSISL